MQTALPSIAAYCKAETSLKHIDKETRNDRSELFDCTKTLKDLIKNSMITNSINSVEIDVNGEAHYIRFNVPQPSKQLSNEDIMEASKNITHVFNSGAYVPDALVKLMTDRIREIQAKTITIEKKNIVLCKHKGKESSINIIEAPNETNKLITDLIDVHGRLSTLRKRTKEVKKVHVDTKKRINKDVLDSLKSVQGMTQQVQIVDPKNGLRQSMVLKATVSEKKVPIGIRTIVPLIKEAAGNALTKIGSLTPEEFEEEFQDELLSLLSERPKKVTSRLQFSKKSGITN
jgi:hypothetical protein